MRPLHVILLTIGAAVVGGVGVRLALKPATPAIPAAAVPQAAATVPAADSVPAKSIHKASAKPAAKAIPESQEVKIALPRITSPIQTEPSIGSPFNREPVGVFTGVDPSDPRVFHFAEN